MADDERHLLGRAERGRDDQIALALPVVIVGDDDEFALGKGLQNFLDRIGHFSKISYWAGSALAGLMRPRQRQYAGQNVADGHGGKAILRRGSRVRKSLTKSGLNRHGRGHNNKKQRRARTFWEDRFREEQYAFRAFSIEFPSDGMRRLGPAGSDRGIAAATRLRCGRMAEPRYHLLCALCAGRLDRPDQPQIFRAAREATQGEGDRREQARRLRYHRHRRGDPGSTRTATPSGSAPVPHWRTSRWR